MIDSAIKKSIILKGILSFIVYFATITVVQFIAFGKAGFTTHNIFTWIFFVFMGIWKSSSWIKRSIKQIEGDNQPEDDELSE